jgi:hypothetical protein
MKLPASLSSPGSSTGAASMISTRLPSRAKAWPSSEPVGPPPSTVSAVGSSRRSQTVSLVRKFTPSSPAMGGTVGREPVAMIAAR